MDFSKILLYLFDDLDPGTIRIPIVFTLVDIKDCLDVAFNAQLKKQGLDKISDKRDMYKYSIKGVLNECVYAAKDIGNEPNTILQVGVHVNFV